MIEGTARGKRRGLFREFFVVMFGVLVALGLEQVVSDWQEGRRAQATLEAMHEEFRDFAMVFRLRQATSPCAVARLDELEAHLGQTGPLPALEGVGRTPYLFSSRGGWRGDAPELVSRHKDPQAALAYGEAYQGMEEFAQLSALEQSHWAALQTLATAESEPDDARRWRLREHIAGARNTNLLLTAIADQMLERLIAIGIDVDAQPLPVDMRTRPVCQPMRVPALAVVPTPGMH